MLRVVAGGFLAATLVAADGSCSSPGLCLDPSTDGDEVAALQLKNHKASQPTPFAETWADNLINQFLGISSLTKEVLPFREGGAAQGDYVGYMPLLSTHGFMQSETNQKLQEVTKVMILVQEYSSDPKKTTALVYDMDLFRDELLKPAGVENSTMIIFPWFIEALIDMPSNKWKADSGPALPVLRWSSPVGYSMVADSVEGSISPFHVFDALVDLLQTKLTKVLPNLKTIDVVGYSGGCKVATRWSFFSPHALPNSGRARVRVAAGGCSNYMYLDDTRPAASCRPTDSALSESIMCTDFVKPHGCKGYDRFDKGLESVHHRYGYVRKIVHDDALLQKTIDDFPKKEVLFMVGKQDNCNCADAETFKNPAYCYHPWAPYCNDVYPDSAGMFKITAIAGGSCSKNLQGWSRLQRWSNYVSHLKLFYSKRGVDFNPQHATHEGGHSYSDMMRAPSFLAFLGLGQ